MTLILFLEDHKCLFSKNFSVNRRLILFKASMNLKIKLTILDKALLNRKVIILKRNNNKFYKLNKKIKIEKEKFMKNKWMNKLVKMRKSSKLSKHYKNGKSNSNNK